MLFKFASYLLGTNYEDENKPDTQIEDQKQETENTFDDLKKNKDITEENDLNNENLQENLQENNYMYSECIIKSPNLSKNDSENVNTENDCEEENWIYISPIKRKSVEDQESSSDNSDLWDEESEEEDINLNSSSKQSNEEKLDKKEKARFNFYDYFNNKNNYNEEDESSVCSKKSSVKSFSNSEKDQNKGYSNRMEESWVIHPPACFQLDNTFTIEEHPLENLYIENPALSVIASCKSLERENSLILVNSNKKFNSKHILTSHDNKVIKKDVKPSSRKPMQKSNNSTRKTGKKQNKKNKKQMKKNELETTIKSLNDSKENNSENNEQQKQQVLRERQEKQLLAHYLTINPKAFNLANSFVPSPNVSANNSTNHTHQLNHHFLSNSSNSTNTTVTEHQNGSKGLKRNNKVALKRENMSKNKPFTLHRKLC